MPRELIHWHVLEQTIKRLSSETNSEVSRILLENKAAAYLGSLAHDAPYYHRFGFSNFEDVAEALHGKDGQNTFAPLHEMLRASATDPVLSAFVLGMISHFVTDIHFHPLVFYYTGNYYARERKEMLLSRRAHRLFETKLDSWAAKRFAQWQLDYRIIKKILIDLGEKKQMKIFDLLNRTVTPQKFVGEHWQKAFSTLSLSQRLFTSDLAGFLFRVLSTLSLGRLGSIDALFSFARRSADPRFDQPLSYKNPANGEDTQHSITELLDISIVECLEIFRTVDVAFRSNDPSYSGLNSVQGRSLNVGLSGVSTKDLKYFAEEKFS